MKSYYSIIRFVNNPLSRENLAIGIIAISGNKVFYNFSREKISLANKINAEGSKLLDYTINKISDFIDSQFTEEVSMFSREVEVNKEYLKRLSIYNNGFIQFDNPSIVNLEFNDLSFDKFFNRYIELSRTKLEKPVIDRTFERTIERVFHKPLGNIIDINYKVKKNQIPGLFFDYTLDGIGVNGTVYTVKSIDFNSEKKLDSIKRDISDLESLNYRIDIFSKQNDLKVSGDSHYLVIDPYKGDKPSFHNLYNILMEQKSQNYSYSIIDTNSLHNVTDSIKESASIFKFSEYIDKI